MAIDPQRILVTADLHFGLYPTGDACTLELARFVWDSGADVFAIAGDVAGAEPAVFAAALNLFCDFPGLKLVVPGNHDLWLSEGDSAAKYRDVLPALAGEHGFRMLDRHPLTVGRTGFIGNIGWYDYSFRNPRLKLPTEQYARKYLPGICTWNDVRYVKWDHTDAEFTGRCIERLRHDYEEIEARSHEVVALLHNVPFAELLPGESSAALEFCRAYLGAEGLGELLVSLPKVRYAFCGHRHGYAAARRDGLRAFCVGSEYLRKRLIELDLATGRHTTHVFDVVQDRVEQRVEDDAAAEDA